MADNYTSIFNQILEEYGKPEKICFRCRETPEKIIREFARAEVTKLQVITDFDYTLSKTRTDGGERCRPAADIIRLSPVMSEEFKARTHQRFDKLLPIEVDPNLTIAEKIPAVVESFLEGFADLVHSNKISRPVLDQLISEAYQSGTFHFRDHVQTTLQHLHDAHVPVLIFSAGFGDLVQGLLQKFGMFHQNMHVIANFMEFNAAEQLIGFKEPLIHTFNKNESVIPANCQYFQELSHRRNVLLLGDSIGDASMAQGVHQANAVLKIGFLNDVDEKQLEIFLDKFDIVLLDDQSMDFVNCLLRRIC